jgi:hypothetical protein
MRDAIRRGGGLAVLLGISITSWGCTEDETGFFILGNVAIDAPECVASADPTSTLVSSGLLDLALKRDYEASLLVGSQLAPRGDKENLRTETMIATITGAEVHLFTDEGVGGLEFTVPAAGTILPNTSSDPGFGIVTATLIPAGEANNLEALLVDRPLITRVAEVRVFGKTIGGLDIETAPLSYVIRVCRGCLVDFPSDAINGEGECVVALNEAGIAPCRFGQDEPVDCRLCAASNSACGNANGPPPP